MRTALSVFMILLCPLMKAGAQTAAHYIPGTNDSISLQKTKKLITDKYHSDSALLTGENRKYSLALYRERYKLLSDMFGKGTFYYSSEATQYLESITDEIIRANPILSGLSPHFLFSKEDIPNAYSTGEGTIVFNMGLFVKLQNESQVAFALCHELSHLYLNHSNIAINQYVSTVYSEEFQQKLKDLKKQEYEKNKELDKLAKTVVFSGRRHGRLHETEADSMGLSLMKNTRFSTSESLTCLALLDSIDKDSYDPQKSLPKIFNSASYPFRSSWLKQENSFFGVSVDHPLHYKEEDSLKTHPDCSARITRLRPATEQIKNNAALLNPLNSELFKKLQMEFETEEIAYTFKADQVSRCLYLSLQLYDKEPSNIYAATMIGKCLNEMYDHQKTHMLNHIVSLPAPMADKNYNVLLEFIQRINLGDMAAINYFFLNQPGLSSVGDKDLAETLSKATANYNAH